VSAEREKLLLEEVISVEGLELLLEEVVPIEKD
jgi:hypothetical protein